MAESIPEGLLANTTHPESLAGSSIASGPSAEPLWLPNDYAAVGTRAPSGRPAPPPTAGGEEPDPATSFTPIIARTRASRETPHSGKARRATAASATVAPGCATSPHQPYCARTGSTLGRRAAQRIP